MQTIAIATEIINCNQEEFTLTNQRALYWKKKNALILSDLHIGKTAHFQKSGIAVPTSILDKDLARLLQLIQHFKPSTIIVVGDLFHAEYNTELTIFKKWLQQFKNIDWLLIKGNHDRLHETTYAQFGIKIIPESLTINTITFVHEPKHAKKHTFSISGHYHPGVRIKAKGRQFITLPCFQYNQHQLILPAFSLFTGLNTRNPIPNSVNYAFTDQEIFKV